MADSRALYEEVILEHNRNPRNFGKMADSDQKVEGYNPLCGDQLTLYLKRDGETITDLSFEGVGCAISKSAASMMTTAIKGKSVEEALSCSRKFQRMVSVETESDEDMKELGRLRVFSAIREYPLRIKCATLPWHALEKALQDGGTAAQE
jgi:nitrogen fixation protein NifU and related proteins